MHGRAERSLPFLAIFALLLGGIIGVLLGATEGDHPLAGAIEAGCELAGTVVLVGLRALAVPLVFTSLVLGGVGLEAGRAMGRLTGKALFWMVGTSVLAVLIAYGMAWGMAPRGTADFVLRFDHMPRVAKSTAQPVGLLAVVLLGLGFGYYRNQLEEGHGKLFMRFCQSMDGMVTPLLNGVRQFGALAVFFPTICAVARHTASGSALAGGWSMFSDPGYRRLWLILPGAAAAYLLALALIAWLVARVSPLRLLLALVPALLLAAAGGSVEAALPLTMDTVRRRGGVSNRVASVTLSLGTALQRDGVALLWAASVFGLGFLGSVEGGWISLVTVGLTAILFGCGGQALAAPTGMISMLSLGLMGWEDQTFLSSTGIFPVLLGGIILWGGSVLSVFSHACAALVIARGEGEYWVPGPPPNPDELQGLKNDLALAEN